MAHYGLDGESIEQSDRQQDYRVYIRESIFAFTGVDVGGKVTVKIKLEHDKPTIIHIAGHSGWYGLGDSKYYSPSYKIGIIDLEKNIFHQHFEIEYTRIHRAEAWQRAQSLCMNLDTENPFNSLISMA